MAYGARGDRTYHQACESQAVNNAVRRRDVQIAGLTDLELLGRILKDTTGDVGPGEFAAFTSMRNALTGRNFLSKIQRDWAEEVARRITPIDARDVPRGRDVPTPAVLQTLPKAPPGRVK
jgi:hypothetical protein